MLLWGNTTQLLHAELRLACQELGFTKLITQHVPAKDLGPEKALELALGGEVPYVALAVNGDGLDNEGRIFQVLRALQVPVAIWFVDNPWHILSRFKVPFWQDAHLFATDPTFVPLLQKAGAHSVHFLPLAVAPHMWRPLPWETGNYRSEMKFASGPPIFVGRLAFPAKEHFFAAVHLPKDLVAQATQLLLDAPNAKLPNIHWWYAATKPQFWPGYAARLSGAGCELCSQQNRVRWLQKGVQAGFKIIGDATWAQYVPKEHLQPPVDYYTALPQLYYEASCVLNVTSLQLPSSLSQRHFDVWAAGGLLLTDATPGLGLFAQELTQPITVEHPNDLEVRMRELQANPSLTRSLRDAWRACLMEKHRYAHRVQTILETVS